MSVLSCSKYGCENIMCDTYVPGVGYVCRECQKNFMDYVARIVMPSPWDDDEEGIKRLLSMWLGIEKSDPDEHPTIDIDQFFNKYTK